MKRLMLTTAMAFTLLSSAAVAQTVPFVAMKCDADAPVLGTIRLAQAVLADGKPLVAGTYQVRLTNDRPPAAVGQSPTAACWVEFLKDQMVVGREVATVISDDEIATVAKGPGPAPDDSRVDVLKGGEYIRAWINHASANYLINLPIAAVGRP